MGAAEEMVKRPRGRPPGPIGPYGKNNTTLKSALTVALNRVIVDPNNPKAAQVAIHRIADKLVEMAISGDLGAIREVFDRMEGKAPIAINAVDDQGNTVPTGITVMFVGSSSSD